MKVRLFFLLTVMLMTYETALGQSSKKVSLDIQQHFIPIDGSSELLPPAFYINEFRLSQLRINGSEVDMKEMKYYGQGYDIGIEAESLNVGKEAKISIKESEVATSSK